MSPYALYPTPSGRSACDPGTGLASRTALLGALEGMLRSARLTGHAVAVLNLRLVGRDPRAAVGGSPPLLRESADMVRVIIGECGVAGRVSGDELAVGLPDVLHPSMALGMAHRLHRALRGLHGSGGYIGIAMYPDDAGDAEALMRAAERATPTMDAIGYARAPARDAASDVGAGSRRSTYARTGHLRLVT